MTAGIPGPEASCHVHDCGKGPRSREQGFPPERLLFKGHYLPCLSFPHKIRRPTVGEQGSVGRKPQTESQHSPHGFSKEPRGWEPTDARVTSRLFRKLAGGRNRPSQGSALPRGPSLSHWKTRDKGLRMEASRNEPPLTETCPPRELAGHRCRLIPGGQDHSLPVTPWHLYSDFQRGGELFSKTPHGFPRTPKMKYGQKS